MARVYLSLGSNLGNRLENLRSGVQLLPTVGIHPLCWSKVYETVPVGETPDPRPYLNLGLWAETALEPLDLLRAVKSVERALGRQPTAQRWLPRPLDIDIILYDQLVWEHPLLKIPHPRMRERAFVLVPLAEMSPELVLPDGTPLTEALQDPNVRTQSVQEFGRLEVEALPFPMSSAD
ncbi:MAG: 2-amino-4-hydroxy-6-hydroxymethyldihydropteridine diphosphokinase [Fimbriimonadales bacterium]